MKKAYETSEIVFIAMMDEDVIRTSSVEEGVGGGAGEDEM